MKGHAIVSRIWSEVKRRGLGGAKRIKQQVAMASCLAKARLTDNEDLTNGRALQSILDTAFTATFRLQKDDSDNEFHMSKLAELSHTRMAHDDFHSLCLILRWIVFNMR